METVIGYILGFILLGLAIFALFVWFASIIIIGFKIFGKSSKSSKGSYDDGDDDSWDGLSDGWSDGTWYGGSDSGD